MNKRVLAFLLGGLVGAVANAQGPATVSFQNHRHAYYADEEALLVVTCANASPQPIQGASLTLNVGGVITRSAEVGEIPAGKDAVRSFRLAGIPLQPGPYELRATLAVGANVVGEAIESLAVARRPNPDRLMVWLWGGGGAQWYLDHGFTTWSGPNWESNLHSPDVAKALDDGLLAGADVGISPNGGLRDIDPSQIPDPDARNAGVEERHKITLANPFNPEVARRQDDANRNLMEFVKDYAQVNTAFFNTEVVDTLMCNRNKAGLELLQDTLGFTEGELGAPTFVAPNVIADDDRAYLYHKFRYKQGSGLALANQRTADMLHRYRRDILAINDPYRETALLDMFPGLDVIGTWTYTNPDPKLMLYIETLRAACKPTGQIPLNTVTLLNYPGELAPTDEWMLMGPGRLTVTTWINLSRAPKILGYYYSSECNPVDADTNKVPYATSATLQVLSRKVFKPYGPMLTTLEVAPRKIAVLSSAAARLYGKSPGLLGGYGNMQIYHFYTVMAMAHLQADVVFDETIERFGLDGYDVLALPKCDVLTKTVYDKVLGFQRRGGLVIADQYLGPDVPGVIKFDFDFTYRTKVTANAIVKNTATADWDDHLQPGSAEIQAVQGVTAQDDQRIMESYAARLKSELKDKVALDVDCDAPTVLFNMLEKGAAKYLVIINDLRTYDDREGKYKAVLGKILPQVATIRLCTWDHPELYVYDLLDRKALDVAAVGDAREFTVALDELGGKIVALSPTKFGQITIEAPAKMKLGSRSDVTVSLFDPQGNYMPGLQPVQISITGADGKPNAASDYYCARNGVLRIPFTPALNDAKGRWQVNALDLTVGLESDADFEVVQ